VAGPPESSAGVRTVALPVMLVQVVGEHLESQRGRPKGVDCQRVWARQIPTLPAR
jgi:hypothetical protein